MYQYNVPYRGRPEDRVYRRELRPRRTRSEDPRSNREFIDNTLNEIRRKQSVQTGNEMQMSCEEIDLLLNTIRRSRSQSQTKDELNNNQPYRPAEAAKNSTKLDPPPPPQTPPPPLPATSTPFGDALSNNWSPMTRRSRTPRSLKTTSLYCQGSTQTTKEPLNMPEKKFWQIGHCLSGERDKRSSPPLSVSKTKQTFETVSNMDQKSSDDFGRQAPEALSETSNHDVSLKNSTNIEDRVQIPTCMYYNHTPYPSDASPEDHGASADRNFNEYAETSVGGSASPNAHYHTNEQVCMTDIEPGTTNIKSHRFDLTRSGCEVKSQSSHQVTGLDELKLETHPDITMGTDSESHNQNNLLNISLQDPKTIDKNCQKKGGDVLWNNNPAYQPTTAGSSSKLKDNKDQTKTCFAALTKKKFFNVSDIHEIQNITSPEKEPDDKELQREGTRSVDIPDLENYAENVEDRVAKSSAEMFQKECADIEQDAFRLVNDLRERLSDMTLELEKVKAATEQLNHNIHELSSDEDSAYEPYQTTEEPLVFYTVEEPLEISKDDYFSKGTSSVVIDDMSQEQTTMSPLFTRSKHVLPKPIVIQRIHPPFIGNTDNKAPIHSAGLKSKSQPSQTFADDGHFQASNWRLADEKKEEGNQLYKLKQYRDALSKYSEAIDLCPQCVSFYGNRSACYLMLGQPRQALEDARTSTTLDMEFTKGWTRFARCCVLLGDTVSARQALTKLGDLGEDNPAEQKNIEMVEKMVADSQQAYQGKDYRKSLYCLDKALGVSTHSLTIKTSRAECLAFLGRYTEAAEAANSVLQLDNMNADAIYVRGLCLYYEDNVDRAFSHFTQVLRFAPDHVKAKEIYKKAKSLKNKKEEGNAAFKAGKLDEAYKLYSDALQIDPFNRTTNAKLYFNRATVASKLKKTAESISDCDKALDLDPNYTKALLRRAKTYMETEQYDDAVRDYENLMKNDRGNMEYRQLLQTAKLELKKSKRKDFYKILGVDKNANEEEIKKAYRKRAMVHHPDRHSGATEAEQKDHEHKFKEVGEAYAVLSDEKKRRMYDSGQDLEDGGGQGFNDVDPNSIFQAFFGGGGMGGHPGMGGGGGGHGGHGGHGGQHFQFAGANPGAQSFSFQFG